MVQDFEGKSQLRIRQVRNEMSDFCDEILNRNIKAGIELFAYLATLYR